MIDQIITYLLFWGLIGCGLFALLVVVFFRTGIVYTARKQDGTIKDEIPLQGKLAMLILPVCYVLFQIISNYLGLVQKEISPTFWSLFLLNYAVYLSLFFFDTLFIDAFVIAIWRPRFLRIPAAMGRESMRTHILASIPVGLLIGLVLSLASAAVSFIVWIR